MMLKHQNGYPGTEQPLLVVIAQTKLRILRSSGDNGLHKQIIGNDMAGLCNLIGRVG